MYKKWKVDRDLMIWMNYLKCLKRHEYNDEYTKIEWDTSEPTIVPYR